MSLGLNRRHLSGYSFDEINDALAANCEAFSIELFGHPERSNNKTWRWKTGDKLELTRRGKYRGWFRDWRAGRSYNPIKAAAITLGMSYKDAAHWCAVEFLRWPDLSNRTFTDAERAQHEEARAKAERERLRRQTEAEAQEAREEAARIDAALELWRRGAPIKGTPAELYLKSRAIEAERWPDTLRWHPAKRLLQALSTSPEGDATAIQTIQLDDAGKPVKREDGSKIKLTWGALRRGAVRFSGPEDGPVVICEGVETGLSVYWATGFEVWVGLGVISNVSVEAVPHDRIIIACPDDDGLAAETVQAAKKTVKRWQSEGRTVLIASPFETMRQDKSDHNDALVQYGRDYVAQRFNQVLRGQEKAAVDAVSLADAQTKLEEAVDKAIRKLAKEGMEVKLETKLLSEVSQFGIKVSVGGGKTKEAVAAIIKAIISLREEFSDDAPAVTYAVPTHRLGEELEQRFLDEAKLQGITLTVRTWRGRDRQDPETGSLMCQNISAVKAAQKAMLSPQETVCKSLSGECPFYSTCAYQRQRQAKADLWIVPHAALFHERPSTIGQPAILIVDESPWQTSLRGLDGKGINIGLGSLERQPRVLKTGVAGGPTLDPYGTADLYDARTRLLRAVRKSEKGPIQVSTLLDAGITAEICRRALALEWKRIASGDLKPGMDGKAFASKAKELAEQQGDASLMASMWRLLAEAIAEGSEASGKVSFENVREATGTEYEALVLRYAVGISQSWNAPLLYLDATLRPNLVAHLFPRLEIVADIEIETPHQKVTAVTGKSFSHRALSSKEQVLKVWQAVKLRATMTRGETVVVMPQCAEDIIRAKEKIPGHIHILHHNGTTGLDSFGNVDLLIVIGRTLPSPKAVSHIAGAITGKVTGDIGEWYQTSMTTVVAKDGTSRTLPRERHLPGLPEDIRAAICTDQLVQAIGRGRGVRRTKDNPLEIEVWADCEPPIEVDTFRLYYHLSKDEEALASGLWVESAADLAALYPGLGSENSIKTQRKRTGSFSSEIYNWKVTPSSNSMDDPEESTAQAQAFLAAAPHLRFATYKKPGPGAKAKVVVWDTRACPDPQRAIMAALKVETLSLWVELGFPAQAVVDPVPEPLRSPVEPVSQPIGELVFVSREGSDETPLRLHNGRPLVVGCWEVEGYLNPDLLPVRGGCVLYRRNGPMVDVFIPDGSELQMSRALPLPAGSLS